MIFCNYGSSFSWKKNISETNYYQNFWIIWSKFYRFSMHLFLIFVCLSSSCVLCVQCYQCLWIAHSWLPVRYRLFVKQIIHSILHNRSISPLTLWVRIPLRRDILVTTLCNEVCQWHKTGQWFSPGSLVFSTNKTVGHDIAEIFLKVALNTINQTKQQRIQRMLLINLLEAKFRYLQSVYGTHFQT